MEISIIITSFNKPEEYIIECIESVYYQTLNRETFEVILIDDSSTNPSTINALKSIRIKYPSLKVIKNNKNMGVNIARKNAIRYAKGKYIFYLDSDDILTRDAIETLYIKSVNYNLDIVSGEFYRYNGVSKTYNKSERYYKTAPKNRTERLKLMLSMQLGPYSICNCLIKKELLTDDIFEMPERIFHEDQLNWIRLIFKCKSFDRISQQTYYYRWNEGSITSYFSIRHAKNLFYIFNEWIKISKTYGLYHELLPYMIHGLSKLIDFYVLRAIYKHSDPIQEILKEFVNGIKHINLTLIVADNKGLKIIYDLINDKEITINKINTLREKYDITSPKVQYTPDSKLQYKIEPTELASKLNNKIVFICDVDYHVSSALKLSKCLEKNHYECTILDNSRLVANGKRKSKQNASNNTILISELPYKTDALATAKLVVCYNDFNMNIRDALEFRFLQKLPTACIVEGINDFKRIDFKEKRYLPYRRCDYVFLAGEHDRQYFADRKCYTIGMPNIENLLIKQPVFPEKSLIVLNVNFTYGCLEDKRDFFASEAKEVFDDLGLNWIITKHPMDNGHFNGLNVSSKTQYELIDECSIFVSRFATGIIEALACGKPVIYFNPHNEKVDKFKEPLNAYYIANNKEELKEAIKRTQQEIESGIDFRKKAENFLKKHASINIDDKSSAERLENAIIEIINKPL